MHVTQRGVNRCAIFLCDDDRQCFLQLLEAACLEREVRIHAYVLMGNHVHLLMSADEAGRVAAAISVCLQRYVFRFNSRYARTGTLFQGRFKSCLVDSEAYVLKVIRYIELNPVRAALVDAPQDYPWSSARAHLGLRLDPLVRFHPAFEQIATSAAQRVNTYLAWLHQAMDADEHSQIRLRLAQERALGSEGFQQMVERTLNLPATIQASGQWRSTRRRKST